MGSRTFRERRLHQGLETAKAIWSLDQPRYTFCLDLTVCKSSSGRYYMLKVYSEPLRL